MGPDGPHRLDNDIDPTMTLSNDRGKRTMWWAVALKEGGLWKEVDFDMRVNLS